MSKLTGSCHCNSIKFEFESTIDSPISCNCSFCSRRAAIVQIVLEPMFTLTLGADKLSSYGNKPFAKHQFCSNCGIQVFTKIDEESGRKVAVNLHCVDGVDCDSLEPMQFDGKNILDIAK